MGYDEYTLTDLEVGGGRRTRDGCAMSEGTEGIMSEGPPRKRNQGQE